MTSRDSLSYSHKSESLTLREVLATPSFQETEVLAGSSGLDRVVSSVNVMENPDIIPWVKNRELLIDLKDGGVPGDSMTVMIGQEFRMACREPCRVGARFLTHHSVRKTIL